MNKPVKYRYVVSYQYMATRGVRKTLGRKRKNGTGRMEPALVGGRTIERHCGLTRSGRRLSSAAESCQVCDGIWRFPLSVRLRLLRMHIWCVRVCVCLLDAENTSGLGCTSGSVDLPPPDRSQSASLLRNPGRLPWRDALRGLVLVRLGGEDEGERLHRSTEGRRFLPVVPPAERGDGFGRRSYWTSN
ncbi:hypothetical protein LY76DRAFT_157873 [Colletotrichum caudatum]|nr:hypothetical protein LY76DRAFT_157873 [Colletotrichum caudatum]